MGQCGGASVSLHPPPLQLKRRTRQSLTRGAGRSRLKGSKHVGAWCTAGLRGIERCVVCSRCLSNPR